MATLVVASSLLLAPGWAASGALGPRLLALEAVLLVGAFLVLPRTRWSRGLAWLAAGLVVGVAVLLLGDALARRSLARPLNLYLDLRLVSAVWNLLSGAIGAAPAALALAGLGVVAAGAGVALARLLTGLPHDGGRRPVVVGTAVLLLGLAAVPLRWIDARGQALALPAVELVRDQWAGVGRMLQERDRFAAEMASAPSSYRGAPGLLEGLGGRDVVLSFIESYGVSAVEDPRYAPVVRPRLEALERTAREAGLHLATGLLVAPSQGGMSWLGHGSVLSGLWLENQYRYDLLMAGARQTLVDDFEAAGYRTAAIMPAITLAWPEGARLGYEEIWARKDIDYAGPPLNWVTMPDQFTWSFLESTVRAAPDPRPLFAELGLISSHAPWTPILPVLPDWDAIGDGTVFAPWKDAGQDPDELWRDWDRVREHYARSVGYALDVLASYAARYVDDGTLLIALGDHQPAPLITGEDASRAVPVHVLSGSEAVLRPFLEWGFRPGAFPDPDAPVRRMDAFRPWFVSAFTHAPRASDR